MTGAFAAQERNTNIAVERSQILYKFHTIVNLPVTGGTSREKPGSPTKRGCKGGNDSC